MEDGIRILPIAQDPREFIGINKTKWVIFYGGAMWTRQEVSLWWQPSGIYKEDRAKFSLENLQSCTPVLVCTEKGVNCVNTFLLTGGGMKFLAGAHSHWSIFYTCSSNLMLQGPGSQHALGVKCKKYNLDWSAVCHRAHTHFHRWTHTFGNTVGNILKKR